MAARPLGVKSCCGGETAGGGGAVNLRTLGRKKADRHGAKQQASRPQMATCQGVISLRLLFSSSEENTAANIIFDSSRHSRTLALLTQVCPPPAPISPVTTPSRVFLEESPTAAGAWAPTSARGWVSRCCHGDLLPATSCWCACKTAF